MEKEVKAAIAGFEDLIKSFERVQYVVAARTRYHGLSQLKDDELLLLLVSIEVSVRKWVTHLVAVSEPNLNWQQVYRRALSVLKNPSPVILAALYLICRNLKLVLVYEGLCCHLGLIYEELGKRIESHELGKVIPDGFRGLSNKEVTKRGLLKALRVDKLTSYHPHQESDEDLQSLALEKLWQYYKEIKEKAAIRSGLLKGYVIPSPLPADTERLWEELNPFLSEQELTSALEFYFPILPQNTEKLQGKVHQAFRDHWEMWKAQKRVGECVNVKKADSVFLRRSSGVWKKEGEREGGGEGENGITRLDIQRAYRAIVKHYGERGRIFFEALQETGSVTEASTRAGISRQMGHKYRIELKKALSQEKN